MDLMTKKINSQISQVEISDDLITDHKDNVSNNHCSCGKYYQNHKHKGHNPLSQITKKSSITDVKK